MAKMSRQYFKKKYKDEIAKIEKANSVASDEAFDMFISNIKGTFGICYEAAGELKLFDIYPGLPEDYDYIPAAIDLLGIV